MSKALVKSCRRLTNSIRVPLRFLALNMDLPKPTEANKLRDAARVIAVGLVPHGAQAGLDVTSVQGRSRRTPLHATRHKARTRLAPLRALCA